MLLVLASGYDLSAATWAARHGAVLLTPADLSVVGWRHHAGISGPDTAVAGGKAIAVECISGVLTRLPFVSSKELIHIVEADQEYVAAEMTAFLLAWLSRLDCPVINRPTSTCLCGPAWPRERWIWTAARLGLPVHAVHRQARLGDSAVEAEADNYTLVTVVGDRWFGLVHELLGRQAKHLATETGTSLLTVQFDTAKPDAVILGADVWPDIAVPEISDAVAAYLTYRNLC